LPYVFDRFQQADASSTRSHGGLGIGLTIVRHIVELHGGSVKAESDGEAKGSLFTVRLPLAAAQERAEPKAPPRSQPAEPPQSSPNSNGMNGHRLDGLRILLVDDEPDAREVLSEILKRAGAQMNTASCVAEAQDFIEKLRPDV